MITSADNAKLKLVRRLQRRRHRDETGFFAAEGEDLAAAAEEAGIEAVELLIAGENVQPDLLAGVSTLPHPARVIGVYRSADLPRGGRDVTVGLWRIADPGNVGTLMRTADAFGAAVALSPGCADLLGQKALRASAGAVFRVPQCDWDALPPARVALVAHGEAPVEDLDLSLPLALLLGAEREGLPEELVTGCHKATIPLPGEAESLNVAAAGAIALYELARRFG